MLLVSEVSDDEVVAAVLAVLLEDDDEPNWEIRFCSAAASFPGPPTLLAASLDPLDVDELLLSDCRADIRFCRKLPIACAALELPDVLEDESVEPELVELLELPLLLESLAPVTPICDRASAMAPSKPPPPPPGGGGGMPPMALLESLPPDCVLDPISDVK